VKFLIQNGANVNLADKDGRKPLIEAIEAREIEDWTVTSSKPKVIQLLMDNGAKLEPQELDKTLFGAVTSGSVESVNLMIKIGANVNATDNDQRTPLYHAVNGEWADAEIAQFLVDNGAKLGSQTLDEALFETINRMCLILDSGGIVKFLIKNGANVNARRPASQSTPLMLAVIMCVVFLCNKTELVEILCSNGADVRAQNL